MYAANTYNSDSCEMLVRKRIFDFMKRLNISDNSIIKYVNNSLILTFDNWSI